MFRKIFSRTSVGQTQGAGVFVAEAALITTQHAPVCNASDSAPQNPVVSHLESADGLH